MKFADLHVHTWYSDSTLSPEDAVRTASENALAAIAICDHDTMSGIGEAVAAGDRYGVEIVPGIELTVEKADAEIHLLGYFMDRAAKWLDDRLKELQRLRLDRIRSMAHKLGEAGIDVVPEDVFKIAGKGTVGRLHLARAMLNTGKVRTMREAFDGYIGFNKSCYVRSPHFTPAEAVEIVLKAGGVPVLAHPVTIGHDRYIDELIGCGLKGIEVYHSDHKPSVIKHYEEIAKKNGLIATGGSDCHGMGKGRIMIGTVRVPYEAVAELRKSSEGIYGQR